MAMMRNNSAFVLILLLSVGTYSQLLAQDDIATDGWAIPQLDALETYRTSPLCLPCLTAKELTVLPGFSKDVAQKVVRYVKNIPNKTLAELQDSLCLSFDQFLILQACTTTDCSCTNILEQASARWRTRAQSGSESTQLPTHNKRIDVRTTYGRAGITQFGEAQNPQTGVWLQGSVGALQITLADHALRSGTGMVCGSAGGFGRSLVARSAATDDAPEVRLWTSSVQDGLLRGAAVLFDSTQYQLALSASNRVTNNRTETAIMSTARYTLSQHLNTGFAFQHLSYNTSSESNSQKVVRGLRHVLASVFSTYTSAQSALTITTELASDANLNLGFCAIGKLRSGTATFLGGLRWFDAEYKNPYGSTISSRSYVGNERGIFFGLQLKPYPHWYTELSVDVHSTLTRSYGQPLPTSGLDIILDAEHNRSNNLKLSFRVRYESEEDGWRKDGTSTTRMLSMQRSTARAEWLAQATKAIRLRLRFEHKLASYTLGRPPETGTLLFADLQWRPHNALTLATRFSVYTTDSYNVALFALENEVDGYLHSLVATGRGSRILGTIRYTPLPFLFLGVAVSITNAYLPTELTQTATLQAEVRI